jgi:hypothetical protein
MVVNLPCKYAAIRNLKVGGIVFDVVFVVLGACAVVLLFSLSLNLRFVPAAGADDAF